MSEMVERLAKKLREIYGASVDEYYPGPPAEKEAAIARDFEADARDILTEIREPTRAMIEAGDNVEPSAFPETEWRAMIDAALK